jgi:hypothetical protein
MVQRGFYRDKYSGNAVWQYINPVTTSGVLKQGVTAAQSSVFYVVTFLSQIYSGF